MDCPIALAGAGFQPLPDCVEKTEDGWQGNLLCLCGDSALQLSKRRRFPPPFINSELQRGPEVLHWPQGGDGRRIALLWDKPDSLLTQKLEGVVCVVSGCEIHPQKISIIGMIATNEGNDGRAKDANIDMAVDRVTSLHE